MSVSIVSDEENKQIQQKTLAALRRETFVTNSHGSIEQLLLIADTNGVDLRIIDFSDEETMARALSLLPVKIWTPTTHDHINIINNKAISAAQSIRKWRVEHRSDQLYDYLEQNRKSMVLDGARGTREAVLVFRRNDDSVTHTFGNYHELMRQAERGENLICVVVGDVY